MDAFNEPLVREVAVKSSAQVAKTTILENVIGYFVNHDPAPIMVLQPTLEMAETFSKDRLAPMIRDTPALAARMSEHGSRKGGNTILHKKFHGGHLTMAGANSPASLASRPIRIVLGDEIDRYLANVGNEGNPRQLAKKRTTAFWNSKAGWFSTPTIDGSSEIDKLYQDSDQRLYFVPCPHCAEMHVLLWDNLKWKEGDPIAGKDGRSIRRAVDAWFKCPECAGEIRDVDRWKAIRAGEWRATAPFHGRAGFWLWQGYSPFVKAVDTANEWLAALGRPADLQTVMNTVRGECWADTGEAPDWERLKGRAGNYKRGSIPAGVLFLTVGVDVQKDRFEVSVWGWGRGKSSWLIDHTVIMCDTSRAESYNALDEEIAHSYEFAAGQHMNVLILAIDAAYETTNVYQFARRHGVARVIAVFGKDAGQALLWQGTAVDEKRNGKKVRRSFRPFLMNSSMIKGETYGILRQDSPEVGQPMPPGWISFPAGMDDEYFRQMTAEQLVSRTHKGYQKREWQKMRERNEALDCRSLARAAAEHVGISRFTERNWRAFEEYLQADPLAQVEVAAPVAVAQAAPKTETAATQSSDRAPARSGSWVGGRSNWFRR